MTLYRHSLQRSLKLSSTLLQEMCKHTHTHTHTQRLGLGVLWQDRLFILKPVSLGGEAGRETVVIDAGPVAALHFISIILMTRGIKSYNADHFVCVALGPQSLFLLQNPPLIPLT